MGLGALFTLADIFRSNLKDKKLEKLLQDKGFDEPIVKEVKGALSYFTSVRGIERGFIEIIQA